MPNRSLSLTDVAALVGGRVVGGAPSRRVTRVAPTHDAGTDAITFITDARYLAVLERSAAAAVLLAPVHLSGARPADMAAIVVEDPYLALAQVAQRLAPQPPRPVGVHRTAEIDPTADVAADVAIGPFVYVGPRAKIGAGAVLYAGVHVEADARIGAATILFDHVVVRHACQVGDRCTLHPGVVVGADGFGFARRDGAPAKIPQVGIAVLEDDVEVGANATIDRATFGETRVGRGTKIDNLVQIGHNARVGEGCILVAQSGIAGSSRLEDGAILGAQSGVSGHLTIGARATVYGQAGVMRDVPSGATVAGTPAEDRASFFRGVLRIRKLDEWVERVRELERAVRALTERT